MKEKQIEVLQNWLKPASVYDMKIFISFGNCYQSLIWGFNKIATLLILILKTLGPFKKLINVGNIKSNKTKKN